MTKKKMLTLGLASCLIVPLSFGLAGCGAQAVTYGDFAKQYIAAQENISLYGNEKKDNKVEARTISLSYLTKTYNTTDKKWVDGDKYELTFQRSADFGDAQKFYVESVKTEADGDKVFGNYYFGKIDTKWYSMEKEWTQAKDATATTPTTPAWAIDKEMTTGTEFITFMTENAEGTFTAFAKGESSASNLNGIMEMWFQQAQQLVEHASTLMTYGLTNDFSVSQNGSEYKLTVDTDMGGEVVVGEIKIKDGKFAAISMSHHTESKALEEGVVKTTYGTMAVSSLTATYTSNITAPALPTPPAE